MSAVAVAAGENKEEGPEVTIRVTRTGKTFYVKPSPETCLPALADGETIRPDGPRGLKLVRSLPKRLRSMSLCGHHDIFGRGSHFDEVKHIDPFNLIHYLSLQGHAKPPFCAHPHLGLHVASVSIMGQAIWPWDNVNGFEKEHLLPGGIYAVNSGRGCVHDESEQPPFSVLKNTRASFDPSDASGSHVVDHQRTEWIQLWWVGNDLDADLPPVESQIYGPDKVPLVVLDSGLAVRFLAGTLPGFDVVGPMKSQGSHEMVMLHCRLQTGARHTLKIPAHLNGFLFLLENSMTVAGVADGDACVQDLAMGDMRMLLLPPGGTDLELRCSDGVPYAEFFIGMGQPHRKPHAKYCGYGGGLVHRSPELVNAAMEVYEADPKNFGSPNAAASLDWSRYRLIPGFNSAGGDMMERPTDTIARFARTEEVEGISKTSPGE